MERTRHFVATVYVVNDGATALHEHDGLGMWLPPGGHLERDELPHRAGLREVREELGLDATLVSTAGDLSSPTARSLPQPQAFLLEDINTCGTEVGHQHVDFVYYGAVESRAIDPGEGEQPAEDWEWFTPRDLREGTDRLEPDVRTAGRRAIEAVEG